MISTEFLIVVITVAGTIVGTVLTLRSQGKKDAASSDLEMARLQEEIHQSVMAELYSELTREREKRQELERRVDALEAENLLLEQERQKRIELERRVQVLEAENAELKRRLNSGGVT